MERHQPKYLRVVPFFEDWFLWYRMLREVKRQQYSNEGQLMCTALKKYLERHGGTQPSHWRNREAVWDACARQAQKDEVSVAHLLEKAVAELLGEQVHEPATSTKRLKWYELPKA